MPWSESLGDNEDEEPIQDDNDWTTSTLNTYLNGEYLNSLAELNKIAQYNGNYSTWYLRAPSYDETRLSAGVWYLYERTLGTPGYKGDVAAGAPASTTGAIGLVYPSDYGYAAYGDNCLSESPLDYFGDYRDGTEVILCADVDWLMVTEHWQWTISPISSAFGEAYTIEDVESALGNVGYTIEFGISDYLAVFPTLYLEYDVLVKEGTGAKSDPYKLS